MDAKQQKAAHRLIVAGLSLHVCAKVVAIVGPDNVLDALERRMISTVRDSARYFLSFYDLPSAPTWAWQFEGRLTACR